MTGCVSVSGAASTGGEEAHFRNRFRRRLAREVWTMGDASRERERLHKLLDLVRDSHGWSKAELARALGRDPSGVYPDTHNPKVDFVESLADVLGWPIDTVMEVVRNGAPGRDAEPDDGDGDGDGDFDAIHEESREAYKTGQYERTVDLAQRLLRLAKTPTQRAYALDKEAAGWDGLGRYGKSLEALRRATLETPIPADLRQLIQCNLASSYYLACDLPPAHGIAHLLLSRFDKHPVETLFDRVTRAFAYYVRGGASLRMIALEPELKLRHARDAKSDLEMSRRLHLELAKESDRSDFAGIANTCGAGIVMADIELGERKAQAAIDELKEGLPESLDSANCPPGDWLESYGWWCVFGAESAVRHLDGREFQLAMGVFTNKLLEIANRMENWAFREFTLQMQYASRRTVEETIGTKFDHCVDAEDMRLLSGTIGRFPRFRPLGWEILRAAKVVNDA